MVSGGTVGFWLINRLTEYHQGQSSASLSDLLFNVNLTFLYMTEYPWAFKIFYGVDSQHL